MCPLAVLQRFAAPTRAEAAGLPEGLPLLSLWPLSMLPTALLAPPLAALENTCGLSSAPVAPTVPARQLEEGQPVATGGDAASVEAARRRERGQQALEERLAAISTRSPPAMAQAPPTDMETGQGGAAAATS